jgi:hypothetical protein
MKKFLKVVIYILIALIIVFLLGVLAFRYFAYGTLGTASCGSDFDSGFKNAITENNPNFCLTFDLNNLKQYKNNEGYDYCRAPQAGKFNTSSINGLSRGNIDNCLEIFAQQTHNPEACNLMKTFEKDICFLRLAKNTGNFDYCNSIGDQSMKDVCQSFNR